MARISFEDFVVGDETRFGRREITRDEIVDFARRFDPQPFHLDEAAGRASLLGGLAASGWHSASLLMRMTCDGWLNDTTCLGGPGVEEMRWLRPVFPGDVLTASRAVLDARPLASKPGVGVVRFLMSVFNQRDEPVLTQRNPILFAMREAAPPPPGAFDRPPSGAPMTLPPSGPAESFPLTLAEMEPGAMQRLGEWRVTRDEVVGFARAFDPQPFHLDEAAAAASPFGRLSASGWHTASTWMRKMIDARQASVAARRARGLPAPDSGPSPGYRDLKWLRPVYVGDVLTYWSQVIDRRETKKPGWGTASHLNGAVNQHGDRVLEFSSSVFVPV